MRDQPTVLLGSAADVPDPRRLAGRLAAERLGADPATVRVVQVCARCGGPHGRPVVPGHDVHVGWSRSDGVAAVVVADGPCAVDVQALAPLRAAGLPLDALHPAERAWLATRPDAVRAFADLWVRKEVLVKLGDLTLDATDAVDVTPALAGRPVLGRTLVTLDAGRFDVVGAYACA